MRDEFDLEKALNNQNTAFQTITDIGLGKLKYIDGDTVVDPLTGVVFRFQGFDTLETQDSDKAKKIGKTTLYSTPLKDMVESGSLTADDLYNSMNGVDNYGRVLVDIPELATASILSGTAVPSNKYDQKNQELYRKYIEKNQNLLGENRLKELDKLREYNLDQTEYNMGIFGRIKNDLKTVGASFSRAGAMTLDLGLDATFKALDTFLGTDIGDSTYFNEKKTKQYQDALWGVNTLNKDFDMKEAVHEFKLGKYGSALLTATAHADELFADSSGDMLMLFGGVGEATAFLKAKGMLDGIKTLAKGNAGLLLHAAGMANTDLEKRAKLNKDGKTSVAEALSTFGAEIAIDLLDKASFKGLLEGSGEKIQALKQVIAGLGGSDRAIVAKAIGKNLIDIGSKATISGIKEGTSEAMQEYIQILAETLGTDEKGYILPTGDEVTDRVIEAGLSGAGMGIGLSGGISNIANAYKEAKEGFEEGLNALNKKTTDSNTKPTTDNIEPTEEISKQEKDIIAKEEDIAPITPIKEEKTQSKEIEETQPKTEEVTPIEPEKATSKEHIKKGAEELDKNFDEIAKVFDDIPNIKTPEDRNNFIKKSDNFVNKLLQHFTKEQLSDAIKIRNEIQKKLTENPENEAKMQNGDTLGIGSKEGYTAQDLMDIYSIIDTINNIQTQKKIQENILKNNPITRQSLDANEDNKNDIVKEASKLSIDEINSLLDRAADEDSKQIFEEALEDKKIIEDNSDLNNDFFYGDSSSTGFFDIDKNDEKALEAYKQNKINEYNEASKALNESKANNNKPVSILNNSRTIRANNSLDNQYVNNLKKEVDFLNSYKPEPKITPEEVVKKVKEEKDKKQILKERQSVGSIITDIDKTETRQEAKETLTDGFKKLKKEGILDKYKQDLLKAYKSKLDTLNELIAKTEPKKEETEENKARRLEQKLDELDTQLKDIFKSDNIDKAQQENYKKKEELRIKLKALRNKQKQLHKKRKKLEDEIREARKKKKEEIAKVKEKKLSVLKTIINKIKNATEAVIEKIKALLTDVDKEQKKVKVLIEEIQKEIKPLTEKQNKAKEIKEKKKILLEEYRRRLQKTGKLTDKVISQIKYIDKGFYKFIKELNLPKGIQLNSLDATEKIMKLNRPIDGYNGSDFSSKEKEIKYFNEVVKPLIIDVRNLIRRISDRGEIFKRVFNTKDAFKYNELLKGLDEELLTNLVTAVTIDSMMNYGGLMAQINTDEEIAEFLGLTSSKEVTPTMRQKFGYGKLRTTIVANMQNMINEYIYLKSLEPMAKEKFGTAIALLATHVMKESLITNIEEVKIPVSELNKYRTTPYNSNEAKSVNILRAKQNISFENRLSIRGKGKSIVNKVFSIREKKERTEPLPKHKNEAINKLQHTPRQIKQEIIDLYNELGEEKFRDFFRAILGYDERVTDNYKSHTIHVSKEASIKGKNLQIEDSIDGLIAAIEQVGNQPIYFKYEKKSEHRLHLMAELINPQSNKLHRFATHAVNSKRIVDTKNDEQTLIWKSAILDGLGIKWKNEDDIEFEFEALFEDSSLLAYLTDDTTILLDKEINKLIPNNIKSVFDLSKENIELIIQNKDPELAKKLYRRLKQLEPKDEETLNEFEVILTQLQDVKQPNRIKKDNSDLLELIQKIFPNKYTDEQILQIASFKAALRRTNAITAYYRNYETKDIIKEYSLSFLLKSLVQNYREETHSLTALIELKKYHNRTKDTFETTLEKETDSQNSGSTLQSIFYFNPLDPNSIKMLHKGGIFTNNTDVIKSNEYDGLDNYEESTQNFHNNIIDENNEYEHNRPPEPPQIRRGEKELSIGANNAYAAKVSRYNLYNSFFLPLLGAWAKASILTPEYLAKGRKFFKHEIIAKGYTAGDKSIQVNKFDETIDAFYSLLEDITNEPTEHNIQKVLTLINALQYYNRDQNGNLVKLKDRDGKDIAPMFWGEEHQNINALIEVLSKLNKLQQIKKPDLKTKREILQLKESISYFEFNEKQLNMLLTNYRKTMGKVVTDSMNKVLEPLSFGTKLIQKLSNMHNKLFLTQFFEELDKVAEKQGYITKENMADITNQLVQKGIAPIIDAYDGSLAELMKRGFNEQINDILDQKQYEVKVGTAHKGDNRLELSTQTIGVSSWVNIGVRSPALTTLMADASVMSNLIKSTDMKDMGLYIFDAILSANGGAKKYNNEIKALIDSGYSPILATIKSIKKAFKDFEWNKVNINKVLNNSIRDESETKPYRQWTIARLMMFLEEISKKIKDKDRLDAYMLNAVSSTIVNERGEIKFDGVPIDFFTELYNLNRTNLKQSVTSIDHNIGINDQVEISENRDFRLNIDDYKALYSKYKNQTNSELSTDESLEKLRSDIDNYIPIDDMRNISLYESIAKKGSNIQIVINQMKEVISAIDKLEDKFINMSDKEIMTYINKNNIDISQINQNLLRQHLVQIREAKRQTKKSLDTEEQFIPKEKITVTSDNLLDVYNTIDSLSPDRLDTEFNFQIETLLKTLVMPIIEKIAVSIGKTSNMSFGEAIGSNIANIAISTKKSKGLFISAQEVYAHELVHNVTDNALKHMNVFTYQILDIMKDIKKKHGNKLYALFLNPDMKYTKADIKLAKQMANHVFGGSGRLSEFIAYALTNKNFRNNLSGTNSIDIHLDKSSWFSRISSLFQIAIEKFKQLLTTGKIDSNLQNKIDTLVKNSVGISIHNNNKAISSFLSGINAMMGFYNNNIAPTFDNISNKYRKYMLLKRASFIRKNLAIIARIANAIKKPAKEIRKDLLQGNIKTISLVLLTMGLQKNPFSKDFGIKSLMKMISYEEAISKYIKSKKNIFTDEFITLYENVTKTAKDTSTIVSAIRRSIKDIDVEREMLRTNTHDMIKERIDNIHLSDDEKEILNDMFVKHKIYRMIDFFSIEEIIDMLKTPTKIANIYKKQIHKKALSHTDKLIKFRQNQSKNTMFRNPFIIASRFDYKSLKAIHVYSTLNGISSVNSRLITKLKNHKKEFYELSSIANEVEKESINKLHNGRYDRLSDNEFIQNSNKVNFVRYVLSTDKASIKNIEELDGKLIKQIKNPFSSNSSILIYEIKPLRESYTRGALVYGNKKINKSLDALYYELYNKAMPKGFKTNLKSEDYIYYMNNRKNKVFDPLSIDERKQFLNHQDDMQYVYANTMARSYEKEKSNKINRKVIDIIVRLSLEGKDTMKKQLDKTDNNEWIELSNPINKDRLDNKFKEINKLWYLLPRDTQEYIEAKYNGRVYIKADGNTKNILLGSRDASIANLLRKFPRGRRIVKTMEDWWKSLMGIWKSTVIIKMPHTLAQNTLSNIFLTASKGYNFYEIVKYQKEGMLALADYMRTNELLHQEQLKKKTNLPYDEKLISELQARLENNKIKPLADEGLLATRIEDLTLGNTFDNIKPIQKAINTLPDEVVKLGSQLYLTKDTNYFKAMYRLTQASDFVARYAQIELEKKYSKKPYTQIFNEALDDFIQYDIPTGKLVRWLDQVTFLPFIKYYLHIQKVISRLIASNPKAVLGLEAFEMNVVNLATPFDDSILFKSPLDKLRDPFGNLDEIVIPEPARWLDSFI